LYSPLVSGNWPVAIGRTYIWSAVRECIGLLRHEERGTNVIVVEQNVPSE